MRQFLCHSNGLVRISIYRVHLRPGNPPSSHLPPAHFGQCLRRYDALPSEAGVADKAPIFKECMYTHARKICYVSPVSYFQDPDT